MAVSPAACLLALLLAAPAAAKTDNTDLPFIGDAAVLGRWISVAYVDEPAEFYPDAVRDPEELFFKGLVFRPGGGTGHPGQTWTKGYVLSPSERTASKYEIREIKSGEYMFLEWKSGDYTLRDMDPGYYVLVRERDYARLGPGGAGPLPAKTYNCLNPSPGEGICRRPGPARFERTPMAELPKYRDSGRQWQLDLRGRDLRGLDLEGRLADLQYADFDTLTRFPKRLPPAFDPERALELGKNPGLGVRALHAKGLTGKGVGIAIIDQPLLVSHREYRHALRSYEELHLYSKAAEASMHGGAVASIAVGRDCGVAPGADLYYVAADFTDGRGRPDFRLLAAALDRVLAVSAALPAERRIRAVSISRGFAETDKGAAALLQSIERAKKQGMLVMTASPDVYYDFDLNGLGRRPAGDPDDRASYGPGLFWKKLLLPGGGRPDWERKLLVPMDSRAAASPAGDKDYAFYREGGLSWAVPWLAGLYALALQQKPSLTPELFLSAALASSGRLAGKGYALEGVVDPARLIAELE